MATGAQVVQLAAGEKGRPYVYGDQGPNAFDCSGLVTYVYGLLGIRLPHNAAEQQRSPNVHQVTSPQPGDLVFYGRPATHVAIYVGNGQMIAAPHSGANVQQQPVYGTPTYGRVSGVDTSPFTGAVSGTVQTVGDITAGASFSLDSFFNQVEGTALNVTVAGLGLGLVGVGLWIATSQRGKQILQNFGVGG